MADDHWRESRVMDLTRREILVGGAALAITGAISAATSGRGAWAQKADPIPASEWDYRTIKELVQALQARKISSLELVEHTIARIEVLDRRLNAVVVRDFERARGAARAADADLANDQRRA